MRLRSIVGLGFLVFAVVPYGHAEPMTFRSVGTGGNCNSCEWTTAEGEITTDTPAAFRRFAAQAGGAVGTLRLHSPGGSLAAGIELGRLIRANGGHTEVGRTIPDEFGHSQRADAGVCASACAYAFLGGVSRQLEDNSRLGFHRFYRQSAIQNTSSKQFSGLDMDETQRAVAGLVLYLLTMGIDGRAIALADQAGPDEMRWITPDEGVALKVIYDPEKWSDWKIETYRSGLIAFSRSADGSNQMTISCSRKTGAQFVLSVKSWDLQMAEQMRSCTQSDTHPVLGTRVSPQDIAITKNSAGGTSLRFRLPKSVPLTSPAIFTDWDNYPRACLTNFSGNISGLAAAGRLALRNCID